MWPQRDGFIEHRIAAFGIGADADEIAVALEARQQLLEVTHFGVVLFRYQRRHRTADRRFNVDSGVVSGLRQTSRQHNVTIKDGSRRVGNRVLLIVAFGQYRIKGGDGTAAVDPVTCAFNQRRKFGEDRRRIAFGGRWFTDRQRDFTLGHGITGQGIHDQQHVLTAIAEILGDTGGISGTLHAQ